MLGTSQMGSAVCIHFTDAETEAVENYDLPKALEGFGNRTLGCLAPRLLFGPLAMVF